MVKETKKLLFITVILSLQLLSISLSSLIANVQAAEVTLQEKGLAILNDVVNVDLAKYNVTAKEYQSDNPVSYLGVVTQENVIFDLSSGESKLRTLCTFADGNLQMIQVLENEGKPSLTTPATDMIEMAKTFLSNYHMYTEDPLFGELRSMLDNLEANMNVTKTCGNTVLVASAIEDCTIFKWYYTYNGAIAPYSKFVALGFKHGFLTAFVDNWQLYNIGSTNISLSREEALSIALISVNAHIWSMKRDAYALEAENLTESNVDWTALIYDSSLNADRKRNEDPLMLYPVWRIGVALDKWYGNIYGLEVDVWADNGEIRSVREAWSTLPPPEGVQTLNERMELQITSDDSINSLDGLAPDIVEAEPNSSLQIAIPTSVALTVAAFVILSIKKKPPKPQGLKTGGALLCILLLSMVLSVPVAPASAALQRGGAVVWGSESTGAYGYTENNFTWRKTQNEIYWQRLTAGNISDYFAANGYDGYNHQGSQGNSSSASAVLATISSLEDDYARVAVVDFDHGMGTSDHTGAYGEFHFKFDDNAGTWGGPPDNTTYSPDNAVYDMDIYPLVDNDAVIFAFINTCGSANLTNLEGADWQGLVNGRARGMPFAWTHRIVKWIYGGNFSVENDISSYGYHYPDAGSQVYIGFPWGSASLTQRIPYNEGTYYYWVYHFFWCALYEDISVNQALDQASWLFWGEYFGSCPLWTGFTCCWWKNGTNETFPGCAMAVYGNGNVRLKLYSLTVNSPVTTADVYIDYQYRGTTGNTFLVNSGTHYVQVDSSSHTFQNFTGYADFCNPIWISITANITLQANYYANPPPEFVLSISSGEGGTTEPEPGNHQYTPQSEVVTADPDSGYVFDYWQLDSEEYTQNPISVPMSDNHTLQANFREPVNYWLTVQAYDDFYLDELDPDVWVDSNWVGTAPLSVQVTEGYHYIEVDGYIWNDNQQFYDCFCQFDPGGYSTNPAYMPITSDTDVTAWYVQENK